MSAIVLDSKVLDPDINRKLLRLQGALQQSFYHLWDKPPIQKYIQHQIF